MTKTKTKKENLNPKQIKFINEYVKTGNAYQSAIAVGYSANYATQISARMNGGEKLEKVRTRINDILDDNGVTDDYLAKNLKHDIDNKPRRRVKELELAFKVRGRIKQSEPESPDQQVGRTAVVSIVNLTQQILVQNDSSKTVEDREDEGARKESVQELLR